MQRAMAFVGMFGVGVVGGVLMMGLTREPICDSEDGCLDQIAFERCEEIRKTDKSVSIKQRSLIATDKVPGVEDWTFVAKCDGAPPINVTFTTATET